MEQGLVDDDHTVLGVGGDVAQLVWVQTRVERVDHRSHQRNREVQLEVLGLVPKQCRDPIAIADAQVGEPAGEPPGTPGALAKGRAMQGALGTTRHHRGRRGSAALPVRQVSLARVESRPSSDRSAWLPHFCNPFVDL